MDATPAAARRRLSRLPGPTPRPSTVRVNSPLAPSSSSPLSTPPTAPRKTRQSLLVYPPAEPSPSSPSLSAPPAFDWDAVRSNAPPPYGTPGKASKLKGSGSSLSPGKADGTPKKRVFRKSSLLERLRAIPSWIAFELSMFPHNIPLPPPKRTGQIIGGAMHFTHMTAKWIGRSNAVPKDDPDDIWKSEVEWNYGEDTPKSGWSWTTPIIFLLFIISMLNALYMFTRIRTYQLQMRNELIRSAHASIVTKKNAESEWQPQNPILKVLLFLAQIFRTAWRLAFGSSPSPEDLIPVDLQPGANKVQQLEVWNPGELEQHILIVYSPAHFLVWRIFSAANWFSSFILLGVVSLQIHTLIKAYEGLLKDKAVLSAELMHEYDARFVNPRLHAIKKDQSTQTNQAEMVDSSDDWRRY